MLGRMPFLSRFMVKITRKTGENIIVYWYSGFIFLYGNTQKRTYMFNRGGGEERELVTMKGKLEDSSQ